MGKTEDERRDVWSMAMILAACRIEALSDHARLLKFWKELVGSDGKFKTPNDIGSILETFFNGKLTISKAMRRILAKTLCGPKDRLTAQAFYNELQKLGQI